MKTSDKDETYSTNSSSSEISDEIFESDEQAFDNISLKQGDYVFAKIAGKRTTHFHVAEYLKRIHSTNKFLKES